MVQSLSCLQSGIPDLEILVPTRNRPQILAKNLGRMRAHFPEVKIIVYDDASDDPDAVSAAASSVYNVQLIQSERRIGPAGARKKLLCAARARWCLTLDDDCYPNAGFDPSSWLAMNPGPGDPIAICFRYLRSYDGNIAPPGNWPPGPCRSLLGGAALLHRESIRAIGSFREFLVFAAEDTELALRIWASGAQVWCDSDNFIVHDHVPAGRDLRAEAFYYVRNRILLNVLTLPLWYGLPLGVAQALKRLFVQDLKIAGVAGFASGLMDSVRYLGQRKPMSVSLYRWLNTLPA